jgi:polyhydroxyalkanoate synthesis regulator phasin
VADTFNHRVQVFDASGVFQFMFGTQGNGEGQFNLPWGITVDNADSIVVADRLNHRVQVLGVDDVASLIESLLDLLDELVANGTLKAGQANGLRQPLLNAQQSFDQGQIAPACSQVQDFIDAVNQKVADGALPQADADGLIALATALQVALACSL